MTNAKLLSTATNYAVVQLPGRAFPGTVIQGDSLNNLIALLKEALTSETERGDLIAEVLEVLSGAQLRYENACTQNGIQLPYSR